MNPRFGVLVPLVAGIRNRAERCFDLVPASALLECTSERLPDERTPATSPDTSVEVCDDRVVEADVQTHGHSIAHRGGVPRSATPRCSPHRIDGAVAFADLQRV